MNVRAPSLIHRVFARIVPFLPNVELDPEHVAQAVGRAEMVLRVLLALERSDLSEACRTAITTESADAARESRTPDHAAALAAAERHVAAAWRLIWGDPLSGHEPRKVGVWAELRSAQILHDLAVKAGGEGTHAAARLTAAKDALVHALPAAARKVVAEILA